MARCIFGQCLHRQVHAQRQRLVVQARAPGIVQDGANAACLGDLGDGRRIADLESQRTRRLQENGFRIVLDQVGNSGADARIETCRLHAHGR